MSIESLRKHVARGKEFPLRKIYSIPCEELEAALAEYDRLRARVAELEEQANGLHELFKVNQADIREVAERALKYEQICDARTAVQRLADRYGELQSLLGEVEEWISRDEDGHPLRNLWDDGLVGAYEYDDGGDIDWPETLSRIRDCSIPVERLGTDAKQYELEEVALYREIIGALGASDKERE